MLNFTAVDFETANHERGSICSAGFTVVAGGQVAFTEHLRIYPPTGLEFTNTWIHGIKAEDVADAAPWPEVARHILKRSGGRPIVTYSSFDHGAWNAAWRITEQSAPDVQFYDALAIVKSTLQLDSYKLPVVAKELAADQFRHHHAGDDARACAQIVLELARRAEVDTVESLWKPVSEARKAARSYRPGQPIPKANTAGDPTHPLYGETICFSGALTSFTRDEARQICANVGANITAGVTKQTTILVVGGFDPNTLKPGAKASSKVIKAEELGVQIIDETYLLELLE